MLTVTEVVLNFRNALSAVVPALDRVGIPWRRSHAYDEWDAIAAALFDALVVEVLRWPQPGAFRDLLGLPTYDLLLDSYAGLSTLEVTHAALGEGRYVFHAFGTTATPFDVVEARRVSDLGELCEKTLTVCPVDGAVFRLRTAQGAGASELIEEVSIDKSRE